MQYRLVYQVGGKTHPSTRRDLTPGRKRPDEMAHERERNRVCYVNPSNPSEAVLYRDLPGVVFAGPIILAISGTILFIVLRWRSKPEAPPEGKRVDGPQARPAK